MSEAQWRVQRHLGRHNDAFEGRGWYRLEKKARNRYAAVVANITTQGRGMARLISPEGVVVEAKAYVPEGRQL